MICMRAKFPSFFFFFLFKKKKVNLVLRLYALIMPYNV